MSKQESFNKILDLLDEGKITASEAKELIDAINGGETKNQDSNNGCMSFDMPDFDFSKIFDETKIQETLDKAIPKINEGIKKAEETISTVLENVDIEKVTSEMKEQFSQMEKSAEKFGEDVSESIKKFFENTDDSE